MAFGSVMGQKGFDVEEFDKRFMPLVSFIRSDNIQKTSFVYITPNLRYLFACDESSKQWSVYDTTIDRWQVAHSFKPGVTASSWAAIVENDYFTYVSNNGIAIYKIEDGGKLVLVKQTNISLEINSDCFLHQQLLTNPNYVMFIDNIYEKSTMRVISVSKATGEVKTFNYSAPQYNFQEGQYISLGQDNILIAVQTGVNTPSAYRRAQLRILSANSSGTIKKIRSVTAGDIENMFATSDPYYDRKTDSICLNYRDEGESVRISCGRTGLDWKPSVKGQHILTCHVFQFLNDSLFGASNRTYYFDTSTGGKASDGKEVQKSYVFPTNKKFIYVNSIGLSWESSVSSTSQASNYKIGNYLVDFDFYNNRINNVVFGKLSEFSILIK